MTGDTEPDWEKEYHQWYDLEHLVERMAVRGFLSARRYINIKGEGPKQMTLYEVESPEVLEKPEYRRLFNPPTDWSQRISQHIKLNRGVFQANLLPSRARRDHWQGPLRGVGQRRGGMG